MPRRGRAEPEAFEEPLPYADEPTTSYRAELEKELDKLRRAFPLKDETSRTPTPGYRFINGRWDYTAPRLPSRWGDVVLPDGSRRARTREEALAHQEWKRTQERGSR